jgi:uncharacterized membrane-anchored protein
MQKTFDDYTTKVPEVTLIFWIIKIAATTLGETDGDTVTMSLPGVTMPRSTQALTGTGLFLVALMVLVGAQNTAKKFHPFLYWAAIVASTTVGTTMADFADRSLGIGYAGDRRSPAGFLGLIESWILDESNSNQTRGPFWGTGRGYPTSTNGQGSF